MDRCFTWGIRGFMLSVTLILTGCVKSYVVDYQSSRDFQSVKTIELIEPKADGESEALGLTDQRVAEILGRLLPTKGMTVSQGAADALVRWRYEQVTELRNDGVTWGFGYGFGIRSRTAAGVSVQSAPPIEASTGWKLVLEFIDPETRQVFWSAVSRDPLRQDGKPEVRMQRLESLLSDMLEDYPPAE